MASKLKGIEPELVKPGRAKILVSGPAGVGKTTQVIRFPKVYYQDHEGGAREESYTKSLKASGALYFGPEQGSLSMDEVIGQARALRTEKHPYLTTVHDSLTELLLIAQAEESDRLDAMAQKDEFGTSKKPGARKMRRLLGIYAGTDMNVIFIAHSKALWGMVNNQREQIGTTADSGYEKLAYVLDLWLEIEAEGPNRYMRVRKTRHAGFELGKRYPWTYEEFATRFGRERIEGSMETAQLLEPAQLARIKNYREIGVISEENEIAWFKKFGTEAYEDITAKQAVALLDWAQKKIEGKEAK